MSEKEIKITAIIAAYNEADIIAESVGALIEDGIAVYLLDDGSTDGTVEALGKFKGSGMLVTENISADSDKFEYEKILRRKEELAACLDSDWFINADADEFRESPFPNMCLSEAIKFVDACGYNAIDFEVLNFLPAESDKRGADIRESFKYYARGDEYDFTQIRCWKKQHIPVDLVSGAGHQVVFPGRKIFPIRFILRHYPIRSQEHGRRKIIDERLARFNDEELERGWHVQYQSYRDGQSFLGDRDKLTLYDPDEARINLMIHNRQAELAETVEGTVDSRLKENEILTDRYEKDIDRIQKKVESLSVELDQVNRKLIETESVLDLRNRESEELGHKLHEANLRLEELGPALDKKNREAESLAKRLDGKNREASKLGIALDERNREAGRLGKELDEKNIAVDRLGENLHACNLEIEELRAEISRLDTALRATIGYRLGRLLGLKEK